MPTDTLRRDVEECLRETDSRLGFWARYLDRAEYQVVAEIGVWRGTFAAHLLEHCQGVSRYYMVDPWRHLPDWNKVANVEPAAFEAVYQEALSKTQFAAARRVILRGKTVEVLDQIPDGSLDFAYIDGDHTLRGITVDLIRTYSKLRPGGVIGGDDFSNTIWQHSIHFEPTLVFPFAVHFAEATGATIFALPHNQFLLVKPTAPGAKHTFCDLAGYYRSTELRRQLYGPVAVGRTLMQTLPAPLQRALRAVRRQV